MLNLPPDRSRATAAGCLWIAVLMSGCSDEPTSPDATRPPAIGNLSVVGVGGGSVTLASLSPVMLAP